MQMPWANNTIDNRLSWHEHTMKVSDSFNENVLVLKWIKSLPKSVLQTIYYRIILPSVLHGIVVWCLCSQSLLENIDHIHYGQIIFTLPIDIHSAKERNLPLEPHHSVFYLEAVNYYWF